MANTTKVASRPAVSSALGKYVLARTVAKAL
jgi:hypothetical protein